MIINIDIKMLLVNQSGMLNLICILFPMLEYRQI